MRPPQTLTKILDSEKELIEKYAQHIEQEKKKVYDEYAKMEETLLTLLHGARDKVIADLDSQVQKFKALIQD